MFLLIDLPGELSFPFNSGIKQDTNITLVSNLIAKHYVEFKKIYKDYQTVEEKHIEYEHITNYLRDVLSEKAKFLDS